MTSYYLVYDILNIMQMKRFQKDALINVYHTERDLAFSFWSVLVVLCGFVWAFSSCGAQGLLFIMTCGLLTVETSIVAEHRL